MVVVVVVSAPRIILYCIVRPSSIPTMDWEFLEVVKAISNSNISYI